MWDLIFLLMYIFNSKKQFPPLYMGTILAYDKMDNIS